MVLLKDEPKVGFQLIEEELHNEATAKDDGLTRGL